MKKKVIAGHDGRERAQCNLYLPVDLVERLRKAARAEGVSLNLWVTTYLEDKP